EHERGVVGGGHVDRVVAPPAELDRLALDRLARSALRLLHEADGETRAEPAAVVEERAERGQRETIAHVHRDRGAVRGVERRVAASRLALVLDVVVDEEGVVQQLERGGGPERILGRGAEDAGGGDADARTQHAPAPLRILDRRPVEVAVRLARPEVVDQRDAGDVPVLAQHHAREIETLAHAPRRPPSPTVTVNHPIGQFASSSSTGPTYVAAG